MEDIMAKIKDNELYTIAEISIISGVRETTLRKRLLDDEPILSFKNGILSVNGKDAKKLILFRKRGRKPLNKLN